MKYNNQGLRQILDKFPSINILVIGDIMLDKYIQGAVNRISPEAPVPVVKVKNIEYRIGGAGNVAANLRSLNCNVTLASICGQDTYGRKIETNLNKQNINTSILFDSNRPTSVKTRIIAQHQQVVRVDEEDNSDFSLGKQKQLLEIILNNNIKYDGVILSDYAKGLLSSDFIKLIQTGYSGLPILIDPKGYDYSKYSFASMIKPNWSEFKTAINQPSLQISDIDVHARKITRELGLQGLIVTLGENGVFVLDESGKSQILPTLARDVFDVSGAGDTFIATFSAGLLCSGNWQKAAKLANIASGIVVGKVGTAVVKQDEILASLND